MYSCSCDEVCVVYSCTCVMTVVLQVCTADVACFCDDGFTGSECSEKSNITLIRLTTVTQRPAPTLTTDAVNITDSLLTTALFFATPVPRKPHWTGMSDIVVF